jgi:hypothetical protein
VRGMDGGSEGGAEAEARTPPARTLGSSGVVSGVGVAQKGRAVGGRDWRCDDVRMVVWRLLATRHGERAGRGGRRGRRVAAAGEREGKRGRRGGLIWVDEQEKRRREGRQQPAASSRQRTRGARRTSRASPEPTIVALALSHMSGVVTCSTLFAWRAKVRFFLPLPPRMPIISTQPTRFHLSSPLPALPRRAQHATAIYNMAYVVPARPPRPLLACGVRRAACWRICPGCRSRR